jgi:hypothetical protein
MPSRDDIGDEEFGSSDLAAIREAEFRAAERQSADSFDAYWAGSASASVMRDYAAGRVLTRRVRRSGRRSTS